MKVKENAVVLAAEALTGDIYSLWLKVSFAREVQAGQFVSLFSRDGSRLLPRPISVCGKKEDSVRVVFRVTGKGTGTEEFSRLRAGDILPVMGPLGRGFPAEELAGGRTLLIGGGIGIPPMRMLGESLKNEGSGEFAFAVGYRTGETYLLEELQSLGEVYVATDDGSLGVHGTVMDAVRAGGFLPDAVCACGPKPMLRAVKDYALSAGIPAWISLEERMACGVGVCLGCVTPTEETDPHSLVKNARVCTEGPVFRAEEVVL